MMGMFGGKKGRFMIGGIQGGFSSLGDTLFLHLDGFIIVKLTYMSYVAVCVFQNKTKKRNHQL